MALIDLKSAAKQAITRLGKVLPPAGIEILSYKRNRGVTIMKTGNNSLLVQERGYLEKEWQIKNDELAKLLKSICKREFPRSRMVRMYNLAGPEDAARPRKTL